MTSKPMPKGLKVACWIVSVALIVACDAVGVLPIVESLAGSGDGQASSDLSMGAFSLAFVMAPLLYVANLVLGIVVAAKGYADSLRTVRAIMLTFKLGLIPFFICGALVEAACIIGGLHPIFVGITWVLGFMLGIFGWVIMLSGSIWALATAIGLRRAARIAPAELALHIILQLFFVADVVDAIILFIRCGSANRAPSAPL